MQMLLSLGQFHALGDVALHRLRGEPFAEAGQVALFDIEPERLQRRQHPAASFGDRRMFDEQARRQMRSACSVLDSAQNLS